MPLRTRRATRFLASAALLGLTGVTALAEGMPSLAAGPAAPSPVVMVTFEGNASPAPLPDNPAEDAPTTKPGPDLTPLREASDLYRKGDLAGGDRARAALDDP